MVRWQPDGERPKVGEVSLRDRVQITKARWAGWDLGLPLRALTLEAQIEQAQG
jgi:hypothetical protein